MCECRNAPRAKNAINKPRNETTQGNNTYERTYVKVLSKLGPGKLSVEFIYWYWIYSAHLAQDWGM